MQFDRLKRRDFITLLGGAAAWPLNVDAQQAMPVVAFLRSDSLPASSPLRAAFREGLKEAGFEDGRNVTIEFRSADNQPDRLPGMIAEMLKLQASVIVGNSFVANRAKAATTTVPVIFTLVSDPIGSGLVTSINRPGGNVTGIGFFSGSLGAKRLNVLRQVVPQATTVGLLFNAENPDLAADRTTTEAAARTLGLQVIAQEVTSSRGLEPAFASFVTGGASAVLVGGGPFMFSNREVIVSLAAGHKLPASYPLREYTMAGGLMSYGNSITDAIHQSGVYAGRIIKGEKPGDLPVLQSSKFEFVINLKTAKTLGLEIHPQLLATADEVIE